MISISRVARTAVAVLTLTLAVAGASAERAALQSRHVPTAVADGTVQRLSNLDPQKVLPIVLALPTRNQPELDQLLLDLQDPASPRYHQYLTPAQYTERFAATQQDYDKVVAFARANGISKIELTTNRHLVIGESTVANINRVFHVAMGVYQHPTEDRTFFSTDREPTIDTADLDVPLVEVAGLNSLVRPHNQLKKLSDSELVARAIAHTGSGPGGDYLPSDMRAAYYGSGSLTGSGVPVAILGYGNYVASDLTLWTDNTGESLPIPITNPTFTQSTTACEGGGSDGTGCDDGEQTLDIEQVNGMAPGVSHIYFYSAEYNSDTSDLPLINAMANDNLGKILTCSWGWTPTNQTSEDASFMQMQAQGQTFMNATGDDGSYTVSNIGFPSTDVYVLEVGATDLTTNGAGGAWKSETAWSDSSGGYDPSGNIGFTDYTIPAWQQLTGVINSSNKGSTTLRNDPDVAAEGNFDNYVCDDGSCSSGYGGTSFAAPRWAGFLALTQQQATANGSGALGFVNPSIYATGVSSSYTSDFHDITSGSNGAYSAVTGYDLVTGWGSPNGANLINAIAALAKRNSTAALTATPNPVQVGQTVTVKATVTGTGATPTGTVTFYLGSTELASASLSSGVATLTESTVSGVPPGSYAITASYSGDSNYNASTASAYTVTVNKATTTTTLTASANPVTPPANETLTATVKRSASGTSGFATGSVTFSTGSTVLGTANLNPSGVATFTSSTNGVTASTYPVTAKYNGDANDAASTSPALSIVVK